MAAFFLRKYLNDADLAAITAAIGEVEKSTIGEIRVAIRHRRQWKERKLTLHEIALAEFSRLRMEMTKARTGVLILLLFSEHKFHIVGDSGIHAEMGDAAWASIAQSMSAHFKEGNFRDGIIFGIRAVGKELIEHFPKTAGDIDELSNEVAVR